MGNLTAFLVGLLFAIGLGISGMTQPEKVIGFLDLFGNWDPSLAFVMAGATSVYFIFFRFLKRQSPLLARSFELPTRRDIDGRLIGGSLLFGIGWGLAGFCPGPALVSLGDVLRSDVLIFVAAMALGMAIVSIADRSKARSAGI